MKKTLLVLSFSGVALAQKPLDPTDTIKLLWTTHQEEMYRESARVQCAFRDYDEAVRKLGNKSPYEESFALSCRDNSKRLIEWTEKSQRLFDQLRKKYANGGELLVFFDPETGMATWTPGDEK